MYQSRASLRMRGARDEPLARSPRPYRRKSVSLRRKDAEGSGTETPIPDAVRASDSSEDYVLEADDEKGPLLRLPAPAIRSHKGLKGVYDPSLELTPTVSPLATPLEDRPDPILAESAAQDQQHHVGETQNDRYVKYCKRRRQEVVRRVTETALFFVIACLNIKDSHGSWIQPRDLTFEPFPALLSSADVSITLLLLVSGCYATYPVRKSWLLYRTTCVNWRSALGFGFHLPSRFDPGPLLYPVLLPFVIASSLRSAYDDHAALLVNTVLGIASIPPKAIPGGAHHTWHWVLTCMPLQLLRFDSHFLSNQRMIEEVPLLFPLHQNLVAAISSLVTTSLDPAEIQLLSSGLINLLLFASTPQAQLLKALLWVGGLFLFLFGEFAFKAEVALARIPAWRFARNRPSRKGLAGRFNRLLRATLPEYRSRFATIASSEEDEDETSTLLQPRRQPDRVRNNAGRQGHLPKNYPRKSWSADEGPINEKVAQPSPIAQLSRSSTFATFGRAAQIAVRWRNIATSSNPYLRLSFLHAQALKILLAAYTYSLLAFTILVPVKYFIDTRALHNHEAIAWAIGYFAGDIQRFRFFVVKHNLENWIPLPVHKNSISLQTQWGWIEQIRASHFGTANTRLLLSTYCITVVCLGILVVLRLHTGVEVDTRRKVFHGVMVIMLLPTIPIDPCFFGLALMIVLAIFLMLDLFRACQVPPISRPLTHFLAPYVDGRDYRGPVIVSHIFLLVGCAVPLWLSLTCSGRRGDGSLAGWDVVDRDLGMVSGVVCVGMGDAAASLVGRRYGRTKWVWGGGKSLEGSAAFAFAVWIGLMASWCWLRFGGWVIFAYDELVLVLGKSAIAGLGSSLLESTLTAANDNVVVPIGLWLLVRGIGL